MRLTLLSLLLTASTVMGFCPLSRSPVSTPLVLALSSHPDGNNDGIQQKQSSFVQQEVSRRVALVMAAAVAATGNLPAARAVNLSTKVETIEYENMSTVNTNGAPEKHLPQVEVTGTTVNVVVPHVMDPVKPHYIEYIWLQDEATKKVLAVQKFDATDASPPTLNASVKEGSKVRAFLYCNLHGLWQGESVSV